MGVAGLNPTNASTQPDGQGGAVAMQIDAANEGIVDTVNVDIRLSMMKALTGILWRFGCCATTTK